MIIDPDRVTALIRETAEAVILPRFRTLSAEQICEKKPGDLVTVADTEAEAMLSRLLTANYPGTVALGEESVCRDRSALALLDQNAPVWIIDPVDGTTNFAHGRPDFTVIVALVDHGVTTAGWIHDPLGGTTIVARRGGGTWCGHQRLNVARNLPLAAMSGSAYGRVTGRGTAASLLTVQGAVCSIKNTGCGGIDYMLMARGKTHFKFSSASLPWDHAAGILIMEEAGATTGFLGGSRYDVHHHDRHLLIAPTPESWGALQALLAPAPPP